MTTEANIRLSNNIPAAVAKRRADVLRRRWIMMVSVLLLASAWFYGYFTSGADVLPLAADVLPGATRVEARGRLFVGLDDAGAVVGYAASAQAQGYSGPIVMLAGVDAAGNLLGVRVVQQSETPGFFRLVETSNLLDQYAGLAMSRPLVIGEDLDAVSGATVSAEGLASAVRAALRTVAGDAFDQTLPAEKTPIKFGWPEAAVLGLYAAGYLGHRHQNPAMKRRIRWGTMLTGLVVVGSIYTIPLTISMFISLLSGYWPTWQSHLYWYLLIGGVLFVTTVDAKNPYCNWFCPFGSFQEVLAQVGNAKLYKPREWREAFTWLQRGLAFAAVLLGLALRKPGVAGYEPFATLFDLRGTTVQWIFLGLVTLFSLLMYRPFCNYLCPIDPVVEFIAEGRRWVKDTWAKRSGRGEA